MQRWRRPRGAAISYSHSPVALHVGAAGRRTVVPCALVGGDEDELELLLDPAAAESQSGLLSGLLSGPYRGKAQRKLSLAQAPNPRAGGGGIR